MRFVTRPITEIEMSDIYTVVFWHDKVDSFRVNVKDYLACMVSDDCIGISCRIIKKPFCLCPSVFCWSSLNVRYIVEGAKHSRIKVPIIVEKYDNNSLNELDTLPINKFTGVGVWSHLELFTISRSSPLVWCILGLLGSRMVQADHSLWDVLGHRYINMPFLILPTNVYTEVVLACTFHYNVVLVAKCREGDYFHPAVRKT